MKKYSIFTIIAISLIALTCNASNVKEHNIKKTNSKEKSIEQTYDFQTIYIETIKPIYLKYLNEEKTKEEIDKDLETLNKLPIQDKKNLINLISKQDIKNDIIFTLDSLRSFDKSNKYIKAFMEDKTIPEMTISFSKEFELYWEHKKIFYESFINDYLDKNNSNDLKYQLTEKGLKKFKYSYVESMKYYEYDIINKENINIKLINDIHNTYKDKTFWEYFAKI